MHGMRMRGTSEYRFLDLRMQAHNAINTLLDRSQNKIVQQYLVHTQATAISKR
jgi:hypothetical protein